MDIKQEFREEKNMDVYAMNVNDGSFSNVYVKWLEAKINYTHCCTELKCGECDCKPKYPNIGADTLKDCKKEW